MYKVYLIGAGQIGSRHLQALKKVNVLLDINVIDPSRQSLAVAKQRYEEMPAGKYPHTVNYFQQAPNGQNIDLAIIATTSNIRSEVIKNLLKSSRIKYFLLEKLLFNKKKDYHTVEKLFSKLKIKAWVNCPLRLRPLYKKIKDDFSDSRNISFRLTGYQWGLATNTIHCLDFLAYLFGNENFKINTASLDKKTVPSKRAGFLELNGTLYVDFDSSSKSRVRGEFTSYSSGNMPRVVEIFSEKQRYIFPDQEKDGEAWVSRTENNWGWEKVPFHIPLISETTTWVVEDILKKSHCLLPTYAESGKIHLNLLEPLRKFLNKNSEKKYDYYPFT
ncbi:MAG: Gfo/Idh/MocA family oxidoreductase [bacterium]|nr:Gfo/Idh/MocA family oxidoreductase [bacterium]